LLLALTSISQEVELMAMKKYVAICLLLVVVSVAGWVEFQQHIPRQHPVISESVQTVSSTPSGLSPEASVPTIPESSNTANWQTYHSDKYGFEMKYPEGLFLSVATSGEFGSLFHASGTRGFLDISYDAQPYQPATDSQLMIGGVVGEFDANNRVGNSLALVPLPGGSGTISVSFCDPNCDFPSGYYLDSDLVKEILSTFRFVSSSISR
jgi:hypothetical protein